MRKVWLSKEDFELFHQDINPVEYEFFRTHVGTFKRMWQEQSRRFWSMFVSTFEYFLWKYGIMKDFPMTAGETHTHIDEIIAYIREQFVDGKMSTAKALVMECVIVTQNRNCIVLLDKASYTQNPFYMKETREIFRKLFGAPDSRRTYLKLLCGLQVYVKFAGSVVIMLRRWLDSEEIPSDDELTKNEYFSNIHQRISDKPSSRDQRMVMLDEAELRKKTSLLGPSAGDKYKDDRALALVKRKPSNTDNKDDHEPEVKKKKRKKKKSKSASLAKLDSESVNEPSSPLVARSLSEGVDLSTRPLPGSKKAGDSKPKVVASTAKDTDLCSPDGLTEKKLKTVYETKLGLALSGSDGDKLFEELSQATLSPVDNTDIEELSSNLTTEAKMNKKTIPLSGNENVLHNITPSSEEADLLSVADVRASSPEDKKLSVANVRTSSPEDKKLSVADVRASSPEEKKLSVADVRASSSEEKKLSVADVRTSSPEEKKLSVADVRASSQEDKKLSVADVRASSPEEKKLSVAVVRTSSPEEKKLSIADVRTSSPEDKELSVADVRASSPEDKKLSVANVRASYPEEKKVTHSPVTTNSLEKTTSESTTSSRTSLEESNDGKMIQYSPINPDPSDLLDELNLLTSEFSLMNRIGLVDDGQDFADKIINGLRECEEEVRQFAASEPAVNFEQLRMHKGSVTDIVAKAAKATREHIAKAYVIAKGHAAMDNDVTKDAVVSNKERDKSVLASDEEKTERTISEDNEVDEGAVALDKEVDNKSVARDENLVNGAVDGRSDDKDAKKKLHVCHYCGQEETVAKNFKRCQKCRGRPNPSYYCSRDCQVKHWKTHKFEHKNSSSVTD